MTVIIVSGTPGTGKTTISKRLAKELEFTYIDGNLLIKERNLGESFDEDNKCWEVDVNKFVEVIEELLKFEKKVIIDSHLSHYIPCDLVDLCIITECDISVLESRLKDRDYNKNKVRENMDVEIFNSCEIESRERGHNVLVLDTTKGLNEQDIKIIKQVVKELEVPIIEDDDVE